MDRMMFDELTPGRVIQLGHYTVEREEALAFAQEFDPQPMHLDEAAAEASLLGGLSASGWHTCAIMMRLIYEALLARVESQGSPGVENVRWLRPVRPGDTLSGTLTIEAARRSAKRPGSGILTINTILTNQDGTPVLESRSAIFVGVAEAA